MTHWTQQAALIAANSIWQAAALGIVAACCVFALRRASYRIQVVLWTTALFGVALLPLVPPLSRSVTTSAGEIVFRVDAVPSAIEASSPAWNVMGVVFLALGAGRIVWVLTGLVRLRQIRRTATPVTPRVMVSSRVDSPVTFGIALPLVVVPESFWQAAPEDVRQTVLAHEMAHIDSRDFAWNLAVEIATAAIWWHPAVVWMKRRLAAVREMACDQIAASRVPTYPQSMMQAAEILVHKRALAPTLGFFDSNDFEERIMNLLNPTSRWSFARSSAILGLSAIVISGTVLVVGTKRVALAQEDRPVHSMKEAGVVAPRLLEKVEPKYSEEARDNKIEGKVILSVVVSEEGVIDEAKVVESLESSLDANAIEAVTHWKFSPATKDGKPVAVSATIEVNYRLL